MNTILSQEKRNFQAYANDTQLRELATSGESEIERKRKREVSPSEKTTGSGAATTKAVIGGERRDVQPRLRRRLYAFVVT